MGAGIRVLMSIYFDTKKAIGYSDNLDLKRLCFQEHSVSQKALSKSKRHFVCPYARRTRESNG